MNSPVIFLFFLLIFTWLGIGTYYIKRFMDNYRTLTDGVNRKSLDIVLGNIVKEVNSSKKDIATLMNRCDTMEVNEQFHIQKIGLLRFNPFNDTGGDQSFILSLVDAHDTGVVI